MKIVFIGGGTGGHFYPLIAVAEEIDWYAQENQLVQPKKYYFGPEKYDEKALYETGMTYVYCSAGKRRRTKDFISRFKNFFAFFPIIAGILKAFISLFFIFPDVIFSKGGYTSFPVLVAARVLRIPVIIHESDATFGRVNKWSASFARYIAIAYPEAEQELSAAEKKRTALIGIPLRRNLIYNPSPEAHDLLKLDKDVPTVLVLGGSSGAQYINDNILDALIPLLKKYQVIHQTGAKHIDIVTQESGSVLHNLRDLHTYRPFAFFNAYYMRVAYSVADIVITRAGSGTLFEIAMWGIPAIIIPIREEVSHDQRSNAYAYARATGNTVIEEQNLVPNLLIDQIDNIYKSSKKRKEIVKQSKKISSPDAAKKIARLLVDVLKTHES